MNLFTADIVWRALLIATIGDLAVPYALALAYPGYSHKRQTMSELGAKGTPTAQWYSRWLILAGTFLLAGALGLFILYRGYSMVLRGLLLALIAAFAVGGCILSGIFPVSAGGQEQDSAHRIHGVAAGLGFMAMLVTPLVASRLGHASGDSVLSGLGTVCFILAVGFFVLFGASDKPSLPKWLTGNTGTWQRLSLLFVYLPLIWIAVKQLI